MIFVVDSSDRDRIEEANEELHKALKEQELENVKVLIFANKQDLPQAMPSAEVAEKLHLSSIKGKPWYIQPCSAVSGDGLSEGLDWLANALNPANVKKKK